MIILSPVAVSAYHRYPHEFNSAPNGYSKYVCGAYTQEDSYRGLFANLDYPILDTSFDDQGSAR